MRKTTVMWFHLMAALTCWTVFWNQQQEHLTRMLHHPHIDDAVLVVPVVLPHNMTPDSLTLCRPLGVLERDGLPDHGGILYNPVVLSRAINPFDDALLNNERKALYDIMDEMSTDDSSHWYESFEDLDQSSRRCRHLPWSYATRPTCNSMHELGALGRQPSRLQPYEIDFLDSGGFREARLLQSTTDKFVLKSLVYRRDVDRSTMRNIQKEAMLFDKLKPTRLVSYLYVHCGTSVIVEKGSEIYDQIIPEDNDHISLEDLAELQQEKVHPMNQLSDQEKVELALAMARSLGAMHSLGVVHSDVTLYQWLRSDNDQRIMLNDVNSAEVMQWDEKESNYCQYWAQYDWGRFKAPEEYAGGYLDESVDVWSMGNLLYGIITGLSPFHHIRKLKQIHEAVQSGPPQIDVRYLTEGTGIVSGMYKIIKECHRMVPSQRISMVKVVAHLERLVGLVRK